VKHIIQQHTAWKSQSGISPATEQGDYVPIFISHGKFPNHYGNLYGVRLHGNSEYIHNVLDEQLGVASNSLVKAHEPIPAGASWITVHPNGDDHSGVPVLIVPNPDGTHSIVGGAGGKLNGLTFSKVKSEGEYAKDSAQRSKAERETQKQTRVAQAQALGEQAYQEMMETLAANKSRRDSEKISGGKEFVRRVLEAQGVKDVDKVLEVPEEVVAGASPDRKTQIEKAHVRGLVSYARSVTNDLRDRIVTALQASSSELDDLQFSDLVREVMFPKTVGYTVSAEKLATERGMLPSKEHLEALKDESLQLRHGDVEGAAKAKAYAAKLQAGAEKAREEIKAALAKAGDMGSGPLANFNQNLNPIDLQTAVGLMGSERSLRELEASHKQEVAAEKTGDPSARPVPKPLPHSPVVISDDPDENLLVQDVLDRARTESMTKFLQTAGDVERETGSLLGSFSAGRYNALMSHAGSVLPGLHVDPAVVDLLGSIGSAHLLVSAIRGNMGEGSLEAFEKHLTDSHINEQKSLVDDAVAYAKPLIEEGTAEVSVDSQNPHSVLAAYAEVSRKKALLQAARRRLGDVKGQVEARAALNMALEDKRPKKSIESVLPMDLNTAAIHCAGVLGSHGLIPNEDYKLVSGRSGETSLTVTPTGMEKLRPSINPDLAQRLQMITAPFTPTDHPVGFRKELDAQSPLHEVATKGTGELTNRDVSIMRRYWATKNGFGNDDEPVHPLGDNERKVWDSWQQLATSGQGYNKFPGVLEAQTLISKELPELGSLDLDNVAQVLDFVTRHADVLGYDRVGEHVIGLQDVPERKAFRVAQAKIARLVRSVWAHGEGAQEFDPEDVPSVSKAWSGYVKSRGSFNRAVSDIQKVMLADPKVAEGRGKAFSLSPAQQRARGIIGSVDRIALALGAGSGKTNVAFASYLDARKRHNDSDGEDGAKRALMLVPSAVQGQFGSEWNRFVDPSTELTVHAVPGATKEAREAALVGDDVVVLTPESWRDTLLGAVMERTGESREQASARLKGLPDHELDSEIHELMTNKGWNFDYHLHDEGHRMLSRQGKEDSLMGVLSESSARYRGDRGKLPIYVFATADPVKNSVDEAWSVLHKMAPETYPTADKHIWLRKYQTDEKGNLSANAAHALRMEMMPYVYTDKTPLSVDVDRQDVVVPLSPEELSQHDMVMNAYHRAKAAVAGGGRDKEAESILGTNDPRLYALARDNKVSKIVSHNPNGGLMRKVTEQLEENPVPTIIFATSRDSVSMVAQKLKDSGHKVVTLTGSDSGSRKKRIVDQFTRGDYKVLVASDAAEAGINLQVAKQVINYDSPMTAKTLEQRIARSARMGQTSDVTVRNLVPDCAWGHTNLDRVKRKGGLREVMTTPLELADDNGHQFWKLRESALLGGQKNAQA
jgi:hypothetical protein